MIISAQSERTSKRSLKVLEKEVLQIYDPSLNKDQIDMQTTEAT